MRAATRPEMARLQEWAVDVAGPRARLVMRALENRVYVHIWEGEESALWLNEPGEPRALQIEKMVIRGDACPFVWIHEFGHAYHCYHWPLLSALMSEQPNPRAEAIGHLFEYELAAVAFRRNVRRCPLRAAWPERREFLERHVNTDPLHAPAFDVLEKALHNPLQEFHALVQRIVEWPPSSTPDRSNTSPAA